MLRLKSESVPLPGEVAMPPPTSTRFRTLPLTVTVSLPCVTKEVAAGTLSEPETMPVVSLKPQPLAVDGGLCSGGVGEFGFSSVMMPPWMF